MLDLDINATFLNFNYTLFLETEYKIPREQILYIHGDRRGKFGSLVLGHHVEDDEAAFDEWIHKNKNRRRYRPNLKDKRGKYFANDKLDDTLKFLKDNLNAKYETNIYNVVVNKNSNINSMQILLYIINFSKIIELCCIIKYIITY